MKSIFFLIFSFFLVTKSHCTDVLFLIDSSTTLNMLNNEHCKYNELIQNFTSKLVYELRECDINYASVQYNYRGIKDYSFSNNNSYVYNKMKYYDFKYGAPTSIDAGFDKIIDLYDLHNYTKQIFIILITDGNNLKDEDFHSLLETYPFNSNDLNNILIKIGTYQLNNTYVLDEFYHHSLSCNIMPINSILNDYNFCLDTEISTTTTTKTTSTTNFTTSTTNFTTSSTTLSTTTTNTEQNKDGYKLDSIYKILVIIIAGVIFLFSIFAMIFLYCHKTKNTIRDEPNDNQENLNNFYHYRQQPRIIHNNLYSDIDEKTGEYIDIEDEGSSLDDEEDIEQSINYLRYNSTQTTDF